MSCLAHPGCHPLHAELGRRDLAATWRRDIARCGLAALLCVLWALASLEAAAQTPRTALVMARTLARLGFQVSLHVNVTQKEMKRVVRDFTARLQEAGGVGLFYYSGHGMQVSGHNYLIPVDAQIASAGDVDIEAVPASSVLAAMGYSGSTTNIVILDACRNNPYASYFKDATKGLARMDAPEGTLIAYATAPGDVAIVGDGTYSPYTDALAGAMLTQGLPIEQVFKQVRRVVYDSTDGRQVPWEASSLIGDFFFSPMGRGVELVRTPNLGIQFFQDGQRVPIFQEAGRERHGVAVSSIPLARRPFQIRVPESIWSSPSAEYPVLQVAAHDSPEIFDRLKAARPRNETDYLADGTQRTDALYASGRLWTAEMELWDGDSYLIGHNSINGERFTLRSEDFRGVHVSSIARSSDDSDFLAEGTTTYLVFYMNVDPPLGRDPNTLSTGDSDIIFLYETDFVVLDFLR